jgi:hypothetical protein
LVLGGAISRVEPDGDDGAYINFFVRQDGDRIAARLSGQDPGTAAADQGHPTNLFRNSDNNSGRREVTALDSDTLGAFLYEVMQRLRVALWVELSKRIQHQNLGPTRGGEVTRMEWLGGTMGPRVGLTNRADQVIALKGLAEVDNHRN